MGKLSCGESMMKYLLFFFNLVFCILGLASFIIGIIIKYKGELIDELIRNLFHKSFSNNLVAIVLITIGAFVLILAFCGCWGACAESKCLLGLYAFIMIILILAQLVAAILVGVYWNVIKKSVQEELVVIVKEKYYDNSDEVDQALNTLQATFHCCGSENYGDYENSLFFNKSKTAGKYSVPASCCKLKTDKEDINLGNVTAADVENYEECNKEVDFETIKTEDQDNLYVKGCYSKFIGKLKSSVYIVVGILLAIWLFEIFCVVFSCCVRASL